MGCNALWFTCCTQAEGMELMVAVLKWSMFLWNWIFSMRRFAWAAGYRPCLWRYHTRISARVGKCWEREQMENSWDSSRNLKKTCDVSRPLPLGKKPRCKSIVLGNICILLENVNHALINRISTALICFRTSICLCIQCLLCSCLSQQHSKFVAKRYEWTDFQCLGAELSNKYKPNFFTWLTSRI